MSKLALFFKPNTYELQKNCCILFKLIEAKLYHLINQLCTLNKYIFLKIIQFYEITMVFYNLEIWSFNPDQIKFFFFFPSQTNYLGYVGDCERFEEKF